MALIFPAYRMRPRRTRVLHGAFKYMCFLRTQKERSFLKQPRVRSFSYAATNRSHPPHLGLTITSAAYRFRYISRTSLPFFSRSFGVSVPSFAKSCTASAYLRISSILFCTSENPSNSIPSFMGRNPSIAKQPDALWILL